MNHTCKGYREVNPVVEKLLNEVDRLRIGATGCLGCKFMQVAMTTYDGYGPKNYRWITCQHKKIQNQCIYNDHGCGTKLSFYKNHRLDECPRRDK